MDQTTTLQSLKDFIQNFCTEREWDQFHSPKDIAIGVSTEANELLELFRFKSESEIIEKLKDPDFRKKLSHELADVLFFVLRFSQKCEIDLSGAFYEKMQLNALKYPVEKSKGSNKKYNET